MWGRRPAGSSDRTPAGRPAVKRWMTATACALWLLIGVVAFYWWGHPGWLLRRRLRPIAPAQLTPEPMPRWHADRG